MPFCLLSWFVFLYTPSPPLCLYVPVSYIYHCIDIIQMSALKILSYRTLIVTHSDFNLTYSNGNLIVLSVGESHPTGDS